MCAGCFGDDLGEICLYSVIDIWHSLNAARLHACDVMTLPRTVRGIVYDVESDGESQQSADASQQSTPVMNRLWSSSQVSDESQDSDNSNPFKVSFKVTHDKFV